MKVIRAHLSQGNWGTQQHHPCSHTFKMIPSKWYASIGSGWSLSLCLTFVTILVNLFLEASHGSVLQGLARCCCFCFFFVCVSMCVLVMVVVHLGVHTCVHVRVCVCDAGQQARAWTLGKRQPTDTDSASSV